MHLIKQKFIRFNFDAVFFLNNNFKNETLFKFVFYFKISIIYRIIIRIQIKSITGHWEIMQLKKKKKDRSFKKSASFKKKDIYIAFFFFLPYIKYETH